MTLEPRSVLFFEFIRLWIKIKPKWFLLENVLMKQEHMEIISFYLGVEPLIINSEVVTAQNRVRAYWTNIPQTEIKRKNVLLKDIVANEWHPKYNHSAKAIEYMDRTVKDGRTHWDFGHHSDIKNKKSACVVANFSRGVPYNVLIHGDTIRRFLPSECEKLQTIPPHYTVRAPLTQRYKMIGNSFNVETVAHLLRGLRE